ncbi:N-acetyl-alpha-D-glucosaminyl L-malate synthase BshA [Radiobacillus kanasensis]|uniref:N-acetyl-alpha-D-glucosaminyl L-malate synthase BshA n=1 Tax=Radiobacillus kanasensis TaxID=2844358 RepID=UPI001E51BBF0|nr:N-acetyl-alpha-D-glucosaminyl L-malate synthase BshA [Radiobacillus kanasensis]UFU01376.1 N-acetyl-alpha-D-glucosaminyl L-malate synthase BshA [Radiobacillus kanasensis]
MKRIGITCYPSVGGSGVIATELGKMLAAHGYQVHFITSSIPFRLNVANPNIFFHEVEVNHYPVFQYPPYDLALANKMAEVIDTEQLDILHVHYAMPHAICAILAKQMAKRDVKIVTTLHGTDITVLGIDKSLKKMIKHGIEQSDVVTAVSHSLVKQTKEMLDIEKEIQVVYNFVDESEYHVREDRDEWKKKYDILPDEKVLIHISNFRKVKRVEDIVYAFEKISAKIPSKLLLVGDGPDYSEIRQLVHMLGLSEKVLFLGRQNNVANILAMADLKLLLSEKESFGLVLLEAMACGVPCIGSNAGGIPEVIEDGINGFITEIGNIDQVVERAIQLLTDSTLHRTFSANGLNKVKEEFHSTTILKQYIRTYEA